MLQEERFMEIVKLVDSKKSVTVQELMDFLQASESTVRRDLGVLHNQGRLIKVHGGAVACNNYLVADIDVEEKAAFIEKKRKPLPDMLHHLLKKKILYL